jgi:hypothetical protein
MRFGVSGRYLAFLLALSCLLSGSVDPLTAVAKKKSKDQAAAQAPDPVAQAEAKLGQELEPIDKQLTTFLMKVQGRALLSPAEAGQLVELKYKLLDYLSKYPQSPQLAKPLYQAGILFVQREEYNDAYEMFNYLAQGFPTSQYGMKAKGQRQQLEKKFGPNYFAVEVSVEAPTAAASTPAPTPDPKSTTTKK